jgi:hypothetical protein
MATLPDSILYSPLVNTDEIRLIELQPCSTPGTIECTIQHARLSERPSYEALSYMWGSPASLKLIRINACYVYVREKLWSALNYLRLKIKPRLIWIDALCINQQNVIERNHQVEQMGRIYSEAQRVVAWLGESDARSALVFQLLGKIGTDSEWTKFSENSILDGDATAAGNTKLSAIEMMFSREYWHRLWIVQEIILAEDIILQCGEDLICWENVGLFFRLIRKRFKPGPGTTDLRVQEVWYGERPRTSSLDDKGWAKRFEACHATSDLDYEREAILHSIQKSVPARLFRHREDRDRKFRNLESPHSLVELCTEYGKSLCQDSRDKIFGIRSFAAGCCREAIRVDYSLTFFQIRGALVQHHFRQHQSPISVAQDFHRTMEVTTKESLPSISLLNSPPNVETENRLSEFVGNVRG